MIISVFNLHLQFTLDLLQIETPEYKPEKSILQDGFDASRKRFLKGEVPYEKSIVKNMENPA